MKRLLALSLTLSATALACTGAQGPMGKTGDDGPAGAPGTSTPPSVSAVTPAYGFLSRTTDLTISGNGTDWSSTTTVAFADANVKVNNVTAASATGLLVNVTLSAGATPGPTDVTVTDGKNVEVYKGAFQIRAPLVVTSDQTAGIPQGGFAALHVQMLDVTTPLDPDTADITLSVSDVAEVFAPTVTDFALDTLVGADVLATAGESVDLVLSSGPTGNTVDSPAKAAFKVAARAPTPLLTTAGAIGMIATTSDSALFQFTPAAATARFVQFTIASPDGGGLIGIPVPKSGKLADALVGGFSVRFGLESTSTDPTYLILTDSGNPFAVAPPYGYTAAVSATPCTVFSGAGAGMYLDSTTAFALSTLPALVSNDFGDGTNAMGDWYSFTVPANKTTIHAATGGDGLSDMLISIFASDGTTSLATSMEDDNHKNITATITAAGTYFVQVTAGMSFAAADSTYELFVEVK